MYGVRPFFVANYQEQIFGGAIIDLMKLLAQKFGFSYNIKVSNNWFMFYGNGSIDGSLGEVIKYTCLAK